jgi:hypothetical protein
MTQRIRSSVGLPGRAFSALQIVCIIACWIQEDTGGDWPWMPHPCRRPQGTWPAARKKAQRLQAEAEAALAEAEALKVQARLEDLNMWEREFVKESKKGPKTYTY